MSPTLQMTTLHEVRFFLKVGPLITMTVPALRFCSSLLTIFKFLSVRVTLNRRLLSELSAPMRNWSLSVILTSTCPSVLGEMLADTLEKAVLLSQPGLGPSRQVRAPWGREGSQVPGRRCHASPSSSRAERRPSSIQLRFIFRA